MMIFIKKVAGLHTKDDEDALVIPDAEDMVNEWIMNKAITKSDV